MKVTTHKEKRFKAGYVVRYETWDLENGDAPVPMRAAYALDGSYIGDPRTARRLTSRYGLIPQKRTEASSVATIGFSVAQQKWFGWSHRAIFGFGIGDVVTADHCASESLPVGFTAVTLDDARRIAEAFAESVC